MLLNIIVATCEGLGIGLPITIWADFYFVCILAKQNAVIMGRRTYESIPPKFRPLKQRFTIVLSRDMHEANEFFVARSLDDALKFLRSPSMESAIETAWVCGGSSVYKEALDRGLWNRLYITRIHQAFKCDTFFPSIDFGQLKKVSDASVPSEMQQERGVTYHFEVYENNSALHDD
ncbi:dihydrofolate reductase [Trichuris trichiura]|uniref:dihydrofolate reductase n=1 Tax=Trichuris trichiura TaxID=36087 RepID=A0A077Z6Q5_TRITR|nr:dihydrofolate reductase [Trichuris trichiura]